MDENDKQKLSVSCKGNIRLCEQLKDYYHLLKLDNWGFPKVYQISSYKLTTGQDRRETGTHYTPKSLTESIVETTLEPLAYEGPAEGNPREEWQLKSSAELMELKICDPAMGSGAFLVQVCRWLSEKLVEAWDDEEAKGNSSLLTVSSVESAGCRTNNQITRRTSANRPKSGCRKMSLWSRHESTSR